MRGFCIALGGRARSALGLVDRLRLLYSRHVGLERCQLYLRWEMYCYGFCCTGSNAPIWLEEGAVFVKALWSDLDGLLERWVDSGHDCEV